MTDTSKIDRMELRQEILALDAQRKVLAAAVEAADAEVENKIAAEIDREREIFNRENRERRDAFEKRCLEIRRAAGGGDASAEDALSVHDGSAAYLECISFDDDGQAERCVLTGLPILDDDITVEDSEGRKALAAAIGWPAHADDDDGAGDEDDAEALPDGIIDAIADGVPFEAWPNTGDAT